MDFSLPVPTLRRAPFRHRSSTVHSPFRPPFKPTPLTVPHRSTVGVTPPVFLIIWRIPSRMHDEKRPGDVLKVPGDPLDDVADDVRYGLYTFINASEKPRELRLREALKPLAEIQDMTSAYVRWKQVTDEPRYRPATFGRYSRRRW